MLARKMCLAGARASTLLSLCLVKPQCDYQGLDIHSYLGDSLVLLGRQLCCPSSV